MLLYKFQKQYLNCDHKCKMLKAEGKGLEGCADIEAVESVLL